MNLSHYTLFGDIRVIHRLLKYRFQEKDSKPEHMVRRRMAFAYIYPGISDLLAALWSVEDVFIDHPKGIFANI